MILTNTNKIKKDGGDYILLADYGSEGFAVVGQYKDSQSAIEAKLNSDFTCYAILKIVNAIVSAEGT